MGDINVVTPARNPEHFRLHCPYRNSSPAHRREYSGRSGRAPNATNAATRPATQCRLWRRRMVSVAVHSYAELGLRLGDSILDLNLK